MRIGHEWIAWFKANCYMEYAEMLEEGGPYNEFRANGIYTPREILDMVVAYDGGVACGFDVCCLVALLWGKSLPDDAVWELEDDE